MQGRIWDCTHHIYPHHIYTFLTLTTISRARWWSPWRGCAISTSIRILLTESLASSYAFWCMPSGLGLLIASLLGRRYRSRVLCLHQHWAGTLALAWCQSWAFAWTPIWADKIGLILGLKIGLSLWLDFGSDYESGFLKLLLQLLHHASNKNFLKFQHFQRPGHVDLE
jgi:hypothetical protein